jgi:TolB protein
VKPFRDILKEMKKIILLALCALSLGLVSAQDSSESRHLKNIKQLSFGGDNAEAYFSFDDKNLSCQVTNPAWGLQCDQIFNFDIAKAAKDTSYHPPMVSTGKGRTTCSFFLPDGKHILYASTHLGADSCPPKPAQRADHKYLWPIYADFDIFVADLSGKITKQLTNTKGYDAEATISPDGKKIVFTSIRSGDLEIYTMNIDGSNVKQITNELGYDGGAFFSPDSKKLVFRASRPKTPEDVKEYKDFLAQGLVAPTNMEIYTCNVDGSDIKQVTHLGKANWAPYFTPNGKKIIFSSNHASKRGYDFHLYTVNLDGGGLEKITTESYFNAFAMFSHDGKKLVWSSNRDNHGTHDTNLFIADWKE